MGQIFLPKHVWPFQIVESNILQALKLLQLEKLVNLTDDMSKANALLALQSKLKNSRIQGVARSLEIPIYTTKVTSSLKVKIQEAGSYSQFEYVNLTLSAVIIFYAHNKSCK